MVYIYTYIYLYKHVAQKGKAICVYHISTEMCVYFTEYIYIYVYINIYQRKIEKEVKDV